MKLTRRGAVVGIVAAFLYVWAGSALAYWLTGVAG